MHSFIEDGLQRVHMIMCPSGMMLEGCRGGEHTSVKRACPHEGKPGRLIPSRTARRSGQLPFQVLLLPLYGVHPVVVLLLLITCLLEFPLEVFNHPRQTIFVNYGLMHVARQKSLVVDNSSCMFHDRALHVHNLVVIEPTVHEAVPEGGVYTAPPDIERVRDLEPI